MAMLERPQVVGWGYRGNSGSGTKTGTRIIMATTGKEGSETRKEGRAIGQPNRKRADRHEERPEVERNQTNSPPKEPGNGSAGVSALSQERADLEDIENPHESDDEKPTEQKEDHEKQWNNNHQ